MESKPNSHDIEPVPQDNEQFGSRDGRDIEDRVLFHTALKDDWRLAEPILKKDASFVRQRMSMVGETILHIAIAARSTRFVRELIKLMEVGDFEQTNTIGITAFYLASLSGSVENAKAMRERNKDLPNISGLDLLPITVAALHGHKDMVSYLFEVTNFDVIQQQERLYLLQLTINNDMYEVALNIFNKDRKLASKMLEGNIAVLHILSRKSLAISNKKRFIVGDYSPVWRKLFSAISRAWRQFIPWLLPKRYILEKQAGVLLEELWAECETSAEDKLLELVEKESLLHSAAKAGNVEFLAVATHKRPDLIWKVDDKEQHIIHVAALYREEKVFSLIHHIGGMNKIVIQMIDNDGNTILHLAGKLGQPIRKQKTGQMEALKNKLVRSVSPNADNNAIFVESLQQLFQEIEIIRETQSVKEEEKIMPPSFLRVSGAALQIQREILWFKEVEKMVPSMFQTFTNNDGKTPRELFTEEHNLLLKEGEGWMKHTAQSCMIVAALIATMVFAAGFTVPGGNKDDNGIPILLNLDGFSVFVISDTVALSSSIVSIIMFLSILTSRYDEDDFLVFGLTALFVSIVSMLLAFATTFFLIYSNQTGWGPKLIAACAGVPVALFGCLEYKLWFDVAKSTYWSKFLFRSRKHNLY